MNDFETDYLIIGAGATGMAFADTLLQESDAHITLVDQRAQPGGHWNDAYPFVTLHQPSSFYGVNSTALGSNRIDTVGTNAGMQELASGAQIKSYFQQVMRQVLLPSKRVRYLPMCKYLGVQDSVAQVQSILTGAKTQITIRKKRVDANYLSPRIPATTPPGYSVAPGVRLVDPTQLTQISLSAAPQNFCIIGGGKTAMDVGNWLLDVGVSAQSIFWVMPRDSWLINRLITQTGEDFFHHSIGGVALQLKAISQATGLDDLFLRLEDSGQMLRIDRNQTPSLFHYAITSEAEVQNLRRITQVIRKGRVRAIEPQTLILEQGRQAMPADTVYINCSASATQVPAMRATTTQPIFQPGKVVVQLLRIPQVTFSAALTAYIEAHYDDDNVKNKLCPPSPFTHDTAGWVRAIMSNMSNQLIWGRDKALINWIRQSRLDGYNKLIASVTDEDAEKFAVRSAIRQYAITAAANAAQLLR